MEKIEKIAYRFDEITTQFGMQISTLEGTSELLAGVLEDFTSASMMVNPQNRERVARSKLQTLITLLEYTVSDLNKTLSEANRSKGDIFKYVSNQKEEGDLK